MGILSLRGVIIPIFDLAAKLKLGKVWANKHSRIVIVKRSDGELVGLAVDSVQDVVRVLPGDIEPPPPAMAGMEAQFLEGVGRAEDSRRIRAGIKEEGKGIELETKRKVARRKLVILLNLDKVAVL
jgi:purine-binding chemotaxis protein CheW